MPLTFNGTNITRVSVDGTFMRTVYSNGTLIFNLSNWTYLGTSGTYTQGLGTYTYGNYTSPSQVPVGQLSTFLTNSYPVQNYGADVTGRVTIFAYILDPNSGMFVYTFIRYEYYKINQIVSAPTYTWQFVEYLSSEPGYVDFLYEGSASDEASMISELQANYPANTYQEYYAAYYSTSTGFYNVFYSTV